MRHKSKNKTRPLFTLSLEMTRLVNETRLLLVPGINSDIYSSYFVLQLIFVLVFGLASSYCLHPQVASFLNL